MMARRATRRVLSIALVVVCAQRAATSRGAQGLGEGTEEIDCGSPPELLVEGLVTVAAQAAVTRRFFPAVTPLDPGERCAQHLVERAGDADGAAGPAGHGVEDH